LNTLKDKKDIYQSKKQAFNQALSSVQIAVEQASGVIQVQWILIAFGKDLTTGKQPIAVYFAIAVLLISCYHRIRRKESPLAVLPLEIDEYLKIYCLPDSSKSN